MLTEADRSRSGAATAASKARVLVVDDEHAHMRALCDTLEVEGYAARGCASARQALEVLEPGKFELLITDLMMPGMDGIELCNAAHRIDPELASIVMTGHATVDTAVRAMQDGALDYVLKPFKLNVILAAIARALEMQRLRSEYGRMRDLESKRSAELALANRDLESFSYSISHDLRAPLRAVSSFARILEEEHAAALDEEAKRLVRIMRNGCSTMDQLIVGLLEFSRATNGTHDLCMEAVDMTALAEAAAREVALFHHGPDPRIEIEDLPAANGDATVLRQVWCNLIGNALKYSSKRSQSQVTITGRIEGGEAIYRVQDNGAGFDMRYADKLFGVFQRLHRTDEFAGVGVGLAIVHRIIVRHGGRIWAQGAPDEGACFHFALPPARAAEDGNGMISA